MKKLDKNKILAAFITFATIIVLGSLTYTYFSASVSNTNNEKIQTSTATMSLVFDDNDNGVSGTLNLGESITKKFTLENLGTVDAYGKINWYNLINTYTADSLTWTLEQSTTENGTYTTVGSGKVPTSSSATTKVLKNGLLVPVSTTYYYKLTITLNNLDINQSSDINASMHSKFSLESGTQPGTDMIMNLVSGEPSNTTNVITKTAPSGASCTNTLAYDGTTDNNLRYVGADPCNYVTFNGETAGWRIVGIMNNVDDGTGNLETRIKLVRATSLGNYSWDSSASGVNSGYGINDWTQADLMNELNGDYLDTSLQANTNWYNGQKDKKEATFDITKGLGTVAQGLIGNTKWYLGGHNTEAERIPSTMYTLERGTKVWGSTSGQTCNDGACPRATEWTGKVALIYPSDYGYATAGGTTTNRNACIGTLSTYNNSSGETWSNSSYSDCKNNDYLKPSSGYNWLLSPISSNSNYAFIVSNAGFVANGITGNTNGVLPAVYLKSEASISGGNGSVSEPYEFR